MSNHSFDNDIVLLTNIYTMKFRDLSFPLGVYSALDMFGIVNPIFLILSKKSNAHVLGTRPSIREKISVHRHFKLDGQGLVIPHLELELGMFM